MKRSGSRALLLVSLVASAGCPRATKDSIAATDAAIAMPPSSVSARSPASGAYARPTDAGEDSDPAEQVRALVQRWNRLHDARDAAGLRDLYAAKVSYYGRETPRAAVIEAKARAFRRTPTFRQSIDGVIDAKPTGARWTAVFGKRSGASEKLSWVSAQLVVSLGDGGAPLIEEETDFTTISRAKSEAVSSCDSAASAVVYALPQVKKLLAEDEKELAQHPDDRRMGGIGPIVDDDGSFSSSLGVHHDERYEAQVWYTVDPSGTLSVMIWAADVPVPAADLARVKNACRRDAH